MFADDIVNRTETAVVLLHQINIIKTCQDELMKLTVIGAKQRLWSSDIFYGSLRNYETWNYRGSRINVVSLYKYNYGFLFNTLYLGH